MGTNMISIEEALNHAKQALKEENWERRSYAAAYTERCVSALKKQIAMQPKCCVKEELVVEGFYAVTGMCPECNCLVNDELSYCDECGQKLDWKEIQ